MHTLVCSMDWEGDEPYETKLQRIEQAVQRLRKEGREVVLVGVSAGATLTTLAYARQPDSIAALVIICGFLKLAPGDEERQELFHRSWFRAGQASQAVLHDFSAEQLAHTLCLVPRSDSVISPVRAQIPGSTMVRLWSSGHLKSIFVSLVWYWRTIKRFVEGLHR